MARKSFLKAYCEKVRDDKIVACLKVKKMCALMLERMEGGYKRWHFDVEAAQRPIEFIERFCKSICRGLDKC